MQKVLEHLSSGYRINRSADDAAGLAISERMRSQIRGLQQASDNCKEGIHLLTVGEGMLTEIHSMLQRSNILAQQSANGVYQDERDRESLQEELDQICAEIERITQNANYNGVRLFQNYGYSYETSSETEVNYGGQTQSLKQQAATPLQESAPKIRSAASRERAGAVSTVYASPRENVLENGVGGQLDIVVSASGQRLSEVLRDEIAPNVVKNLVANYPVFSGLQKQNIGIGLRLYNDNSSKTLVFLSNEASRDFSSTRAYSLNV